MPDAVSAYARAKAAAARCAVTRLADVTGLDRLGVPVFQAIRPWSRALSVHQGKGLDAESARIGALMEAVESDHAERFAADGPRCTFARLPPGERAVRLCDFARDRSRPPAEDDAVVWTRAEVMADGRALWAPFDAVSLDFTREAGSPFDRSSSGMAAHFTQEAARRTALLEVIERDAVAAWQGSGPLARALSRVDLESIPFGWFETLERRVSAAGLRLSIYQAACVIPVAAFICELTEPGAEGAGRSAVFGAACHPRAETALLKSLLEAIQSRLTEIVGARDDIAVAADPGPGGPRMGMALPPGPGLAPRRWSEAATLDGPEEPGAAGLAEALAAAGYPQAAIVDLSRPGEDVVVVKALVPGLGAGSRRRRQPEPAPC